MVDMIAASTCTATLANVCIGDEEFVMEMDELTLAEYRVDPASTYPTAFGGRVDLVSGDASIASAEPVNPADLGFVHAETDSSTGTSATSGYSNISRSCYEMLER